MDVWPMLNWRAMASTGVSVSAYRRITSRACSSVSLRRGGKARRASSGASWVTDGGSATGGLFASSLKRLVDPVQPGPHAQPGAYGDAQAEADQENDQRKL